MTTTNMKLVLYRQANLIDNSSIRDFVLTMLSYASTGFYERPASTRHHPLDERGEGGNLLHTARVVNMVLVLAEISTMEGVEKDALVAGAILHDLCRYGLEDEFERSCKNHPLLVRRVAEEHSLSCDCYDLIMRIIENHMGQWGNQQFIPHISIDGMLHIADTVCARGLEVMQC